MPALRSLTDGGGFRPARFSTTPARGASPSSTEEGSRVSGRGGGKSSPPGSGGAARSRGGGQQLRASGGADRPFGILIAGTAACSPRVQQGMWDTLSLVKKGSGVFTFPSGPHRRLNLRLPRQTTSAIWRLMIASGYGKFPDADLKTSGESGGCSSTSRPLFSHMDSFRVRRNPPAIGGYFTASTSRVASS